MTGFVEIPCASRYEKRRARFLFSVRKEKARNEDDQLAATQSHGVLSQKRYVEITGNRVVEALAGTDNFTHAEKNDFVISLRSFEGGIEIATESGSISPAYTVLKPSAHLNPKYYRHLLKSSVFISYLQTTVTGIREGKSVKFENLANIILPVPDPEEQKHIADFLDRETARIDQLIESKLRYKQLLEEKSQAQLHRLVFALDQNQSNRFQNAEDWMPDTPSHWVIKKCGQVFKNLDYRRVPLNAEERASRSKIYPYYGASGQIDEVDEYLFDEETILVGEDGANLILKSTPIAFKVSGKYWVNNHAHILKAKSGSIDYWVSALNQVPFEIYVTGSAQPKLTALALKNIRLPVPPKDEQKRIGLQCNAVIAKTEKAKKLLGELITKLQEYRTALVTAAVTGQIDVKSYGKSGAADRHLDQLQNEGRA